MNHDPRDNDAAGKQYIMHVTWHTLDQSRSRISDVNVNVNVAYTLKQEVLIDRDITLSVFIPLLQLVGDKRFVTAKRLSSLFSFVVWLQH